MPELYGKFKHCCYEYDEMLIDETCSEFETCRCYDDDEEVVDEVREIQERLFQERYAGGGVDLEDFDGVLGRYEDED